MDNPFHINYKPSTSPVGEQQGRYDTLNQGFSNFVQNQASVPQLQEKYSEKYGVPVLQRQYQQQQDQYDALGGQIRGMSDSVAQGSQESVLTQGQRDRIVQSRQAPLLQAYTQVGQQLGQTGQQLSTAQSNVTQMMTAEQAEQQRQLQPWMQKYSTEDTMTAARMTGWSTAEANELNVLIANAQNGMTWTNAERDRATQLAMKEKEFANNLEAARISNNKPFAIGAGTMGIYKDGGIYRGDWE